MKSTYVEYIPNHGSVPTPLIRQSWRENGRVKRRTLCNLSKLEPHLVEGIRLVLKGGAVFPDIHDAVSLRRSLPHGHVAAVAGTMRKLGFERLLHRKPGRERSLAFAAVAARVVEPCSKLATARRLSPATASSSLGAVLGLGAVTGNEMLGMLDWLRARQRWIERSLAARHLRDGTLLLYDVTSSYLEGRCCPLAGFGHNRDGKKGKKQIVYGLLCAADGCPVAVEVFAGGTGDPATVAVQVAKVKQRFGLSRIAFVGDRGMVTAARIRDDLLPAGLDWISALRTPDIRQLARAPGPENPNGTRRKALLRPQELVADGVAEVSSPDFPGERLIVCFNPRLKAERARKREDLLRATECVLEDIAKAVRNPRARLRGRDAINRRVGRDINRRKVAKHFDIEISDGHIAWARNAERIADEARLDGVYVIRTSLEAGALAAPAAVEAYKSLSTVERAFRGMKSNLDVRPVYVYSEDHVRAHVFLCMLAWHVEWHMRKRLAPILFEDDDREGARRKRSSPVAKSDVSDRARFKAATKENPEGLPVHSMETLLSDLATLTRNEVTLSANPDLAFPLLAEPTELQAKAFELLQIDPTKPTP